MDDNPSKHSPKHPWHLSPQELEKLEKLDHPVEKISSAINCVFTLFFIVAVLILMVWFFYHPLF